MTSYLRVERGLLCNIFKSAISHLMVARIGGVRRLGSGALGSDGGRLLRGQLWSLLAARHILQGSPPVARAMQSPVAGPLLSDGANTGVNPGVRCAHDHRGRFWRRQRCQGAAIHAGAGAGLRAGLIRSRTVSAQRPVNPASGT
jgi:hypothetical protein